MTNLIPNPLILGSCMLAGATLVSLVPVAQITACGGEHCAAVATPATAIDLAICLDTSGSMTNLIDSARQKLWAVVNDLALAQPQPHLRVALLTYGNDGHSAEEGWVAVQAPFTTDLDTISEKLFALTTNGGTEYVGRVLQEAGRLEWSTSPHALKIAIVAGNESADQDSIVPFRDICPTLITDGIIVNSIYCGDETHADSSAWKEVAALADGQFAAIDTSRAPVTIETPFDAQLATLSAAINETYLPFGAEGAAGVAKQTAQDDNAQHLGTAVAAARCGTKGSGLYWNAHWDLVDACAQESFDLAAVADEELPEKMRGMSATERAVHVQTMQDRRAEIRAEIAELTQQREAFVVADQKRRAVEDTFGSAVRTAIRDQAVAKGFSFGSRTVATRDDGS